MTQTTRAALLRRLMTLMAEVEFCFNRDDALVLLTEANTIQTILA